jgi:hypothetical protein
MARIDKAGGDIIIRKGKGVIRKGDTLADKKGR